MARKTEAEGVSVPAGGGGGINWYTEPLCFYGTMIEERGVASSPSKHHWQDHTCKAFDELQDAYIEASGREVLRYGPLRSFLVCQFGMGRNRVDNMPVSEAISMLRSLKPPPSPPPPPGRSVEGAATPIPTNILEALGRKPVEHAIFSHCWRHLGRYVPWDELVPVVWPNKPPRQSYRVSVVTQRLNLDLERIKGCPYRAEASQLAGARVYDKTAQE